MKLLLSIILLLLLMTPCYALLENKFGHVNADHIAMGAAYGVLTKDMAYMDAVWLLMALSVAKEATDSTGFDSADIISNFIGFSVWRVEL